MDISNSSGKLLVYNHRSYQTPKDSQDVFLHHSHNSYEIIFFEKGEAIYVIEGREYKLKKNDMVFIRPLKHHYIDIKGNTEYSRYNVSFNRDMIKGWILEGIPADLEVINCDESGIIYENFKRMDYYGKHLTSEQFSDILPGLIEEILLNFSASAENANTAYKLSPLITKALDYIGENLFSLEGIKSVSDALHITESYFFKLFKTQMKISPKKYINTKKLLYAQKLLQMGKKPTDIYSRCGFESYVGFYKQYVKAFGYAPSEEKNFNKIKH